MKPWMLALITAVKRKLVTVGPYTASRTFIAPVTTSKIESITGRGAAGTPGGDNSSITYWYDEYYYYVYSGDGAGGVFVGPTSYLGRTNKTSPTTPPTPGDFCYPPSSSSSMPPYTQQQLCYFYRDGSTITGGEYPATTGASVTAFGQTFPGGVGGPATPVTFRDVPVTGGSSNQLVIPSGGEITSFSYYE